MAIRITDTASGEIFTFPMMPESLQYSRAGRFEQLKLLSGDKSIPTGESAGRIAFDGKLPGTRRSGAYIGQYRAPADVQKLWSTWLEGKRLLRIAVGGTAVDEYVYLESFKLTFSGGFGDCDYSISLIRADKQDAAEDAARVRTYTVVEGETLWDIARRFLGDGSAYTKLIDLNYSELSRSGGIHPGMTIKLPEKSA